MLPREYLRLQLHLFITSYCVVEDGGLAGMVNHVPTYIPSAVPERVEDALKLNQATTYSIGWCISAVIREKRVQLN